MTNNYFLFQLSKKYKIQINISYKFNLVKTSPGLIRVREFPGTNISYRDFFLNRMKFYAFVLHLFFYKNNTDITPGKFLEE